MKRALLACALVALAACETPDLKPPPAAPQQPPITEAPSAAPHGAPVAENDLAGALRRAKAEKKPLFVDVWAPWCHTCLSMKNFVLADPGLAPTLANDVVFVSLDFDKEENAAFLEKHEVKGLPTFLVLDPDEKPIGLWLGSGSVREIRTMIEGAVAEMAGKGAGGFDGEAAKAFADARAAEAEGKADKAAAAYERFIVATPPGASAVRNEAFLSWLDALADSGDFHRCASVGRAHLAEVQGSSLPADFASKLLDCSSHLGGDEGKGARDAAIDRLIAYVNTPPEGATVDDRGDALSTLSEAVEERGQKDVAQKYREKWLAMLDDAAKAAPNPEVAHTFDYMRANAYVALGRAEEAVTMLTERQKQLPDSYEPPARLARVYMKLGKLPEAEKAVDRTIKLSYGPRRLGYLKLRAEIEEKLGNHDAVIATLRDVVKGYEALPKGQAAPKQLADAKKRLEDAEKKGK